MINIAQNILKKCGGVKVVSKMTGVTHATVHKWTYPKSRGGTDGIIPAYHQQTILDKANEMGLDLTPNDFFEVREAS